MYKGQLDKLQAAGIKTPKQFCNGGIGIGSTPGTKHMIPDFLMKQIIPKGKKPEDFGYRKSSEWHHARARNGRIIDVEYYF